MKKKNKYLDKKNQENLTIYEYEEKIIIFHKTHINIDKLNNLANNCQELTLIENKKKKKNKKRRFI